MIRRPPRSTRTDTLFPYTTLFRSFHRAEAEWRDRRVRRETLETPSLRDLLVRVDAAGLHIAIWDITTDLEIPAFYVLLFDRQADASHLGIGSGRPLCPERSYRRPLGKECVRTCRIRWLPATIKKKK